MVSPDRLKAATRSAIPGTIEGLTGIVGLLYTTLEGLSALSVLGALDNGTPVAGGPAEVQRTLISLAVALVVAIPSALLAVRGVDNSERYKALLDSRIPNEEFGQYESTPLPDGSIRRGRGLFRNPKSEARTPNFMK